MWRCAGFQTCFRSLAPVSLHNTRRFAATAAASTLYSRLSVPVSATPAEIKTAYRKAALACHPDVVSAERKATAEGEFRRVAEAYSVLSDTGKKAKYDATIGNRHRAKAPAAKPVTKKPAAAPKKAATPKPAAPAPRWAPKPTVKKQKPMVRKDADRVFQDEFGQTVHDVLFSARYARRYGRDVPGHGDGSARAEASNDPMDIAAQNLRAAAQRFTEKHPFVNPRDIKVGRWTRPSELPGTHMPFRPFVGMAVPEGVTTELTPVAPAHGELAESEEVASVEERIKTIKLSRPAGLANGGTYSEAIRRLKRDAKVPHNLGVVYSYQRLY